MARPTKAPKNIGGSDVVVAPRRIIFDHVDTDEKDVEVYGVTLSDDQSATVAKYRADVPFSREDEFGQPQMLVIGAIETAIQRVKDDRPGIGNPSALDVLDIIAETAKVVAEDY